MIDHTGVTDWVTDYQPAAEARKVLMDFYMHGIHGVNIYIYTFKYIMRHHTLQGKKF